MSTSPGEAPKVSQNEIRAQRIAKLEAIRAAGINPYPERAFESEAIADVLKKDNGAPAQVAGRIMLFREMGNITFFHIQDRTGRMQMVLNKRTYTPQGAIDYKFWIKKLDLGDIVHISGERMTTEKGEPSLLVKEMTLVSKSLLPLPEKWHGLTDADQIYRQRYLDLIGNRESLDRFIKRSQLVSGVREYLCSQNFLEIETPILQAEAGGAAATPFVTHHKSLDHDFFLRISLELYLKRALVGGYERVFEIGRNFRNEGLSRKHNPEFTMLEVYQAYSNYRGMMELLKGIIGHLCQNVFKKSQFKRPDSEEVIDFGKPWVEVRYRDIVCERTANKNWFAQSKAEKVAAAKALGVDVNESWEDFEITNEVFSKKIEPTLMQPTFVTHLPRELCPLAKPNAEDPSVLDVFEFIVAGMEVAPAYSELNDPLLQRDFFMKQVGGDAQRFDEDFITALEHGMPSAGGMGVGIDRLAIIMTEASSIRDVILFPTLKPIA